ncbi:MAG: DUF177 domain-containing protein [Sphingomonadaceae bacterium]|jgi:uncharacterized metal-binding protein YceD (DUF177 family)
MSGTAPAPEFSRLIRLDEIGRMQFPAHLSASAEECAALAARFVFSSLDRLEADYSLTRDGKAVLATGELRAALAQPCVATAEPVAEEVREPFTIRFVPEAEIETVTPGAESEIEIDAEGADIIAYSGERFDIGDAIAETLALCVDPYPRSPDADTALRQAGVLSEDEAAEQSGPFAALAALKGKGK